MNKWYIIGMVYQTNPSIFFQKDNILMASPWIFHHLNMGLSVTGRGTSGLANMLLETVSGPQKTALDFFF